MCRYKNVAQRIEQFMFNGTNHPRLLNNNNFHSNIVQSSSSFLLTNWFQVDHVIIITYVLWFSWSLNGRKTLSIIDFWTTLFGFYYEKNVSFLVYHVFLIEPRATKNDGILSTGV